MKREMPISSDLTLAPSTGSIAAAAERAVEIATLVHQPVRLVWNSVELTADVGASAAAIVEEYYAQQQAAGKARTR